jgi:hypothetical protein
MSKNNIDAYAKALNAMTLKRHVIRSTIFTALLVLVVRQFDDTYNTTNLVHFFMFVMVWESILSFFGKFRMYHIRSALAYLILTITVLVATYAPIVLHHYKVL